MFLGCHSDTFIQKLKKSYTDTRARRNISNINTELQDVQRIMVQNIDDVMQRGVAISGASLTCDMCFCVGIIKSDINLHL